MERSLFLSLAQKVNHAYLKMSAPLLEKFDLQQSSFDILMFLANNPQYKTAQEICRLRHIKKNLVSVHVEKLVGMGLLERKSVEGDRRKVGLYCTEKASEITKAGKEMQKQFFELLSADITEEQRQFCKEIFEIIEMNAEKI